MARLCRNLPPGHWHDLTLPPGRGGCIQVDHNGRQSPSPRQCPDTEAELNAELTSLQALPKHRLWSTPVDDGHAYYYVRSETPLVVLHVPYGDRWQAHPSLLKTLSLQHVRIRTQAAIAQSDPATTTPR